MEVLITGVKVTTYVLPVVSAACGARFGMKIGRVRYHEYNPKLIKRLDDFLEKHQDAGNGLIAGSTAAFGIPIMRILWFKIIYGLIGAVIGIFIGFKIGKFVRNKLPEE